MNFAAVEKLRGSFCDGPIEKFLINSQSINQPKNLGGISNKDHTE